MIDSALVLWTALFSIAGLAVGWFLGRASGRRASLATSDLALAAAVPPSLYRVDELASSIHFDEEGDGIYIRRELAFSPFLISKRSWFPTVLRSRPKGRFNSLKSGACRKSCRRSGDRVSQGPPQPAARFC